MYSSDSKAPTPGQQERRKRLEPELDSHIAFLYAKIETQNLEIEDLKMKLHESNLIVMELKGELANVQSRRSQKVKEAQTLEYHTDSSLRDPSSKPSFPTTKKQVRSVTSGPPQTQLAPRDLAPIAPPSTLPSNPEIITSLSWLFKEVETWATRYSNVPSMERDSRIPISARHAVICVSNSDLAAGFLTSSSTRFLAIAAFLSRVICNWAFSLTPVRRFSAVYDPQLGHSAGVAEALLRLKDEDGYDRFENRQIHTKQRKIWVVLEPFLAAEADLHDAWADLNLLVVGALKVGWRMLTSKSSSYANYFPRVGSSSSFDPACMKNRDPTFRDVDTRGLVAMRPRVRFAVNPAVVERRLDGQGEKRVLHFAGVLLARAGPEEKGRKALGEVK